MTEKKIFSCLQCGVPFDAYPPDDEHTVATREEKEKSIKIDYKCKNDHTNVIYWSEREIAFAVG